MKFMFNFRLMSTLGSQKGGGLTGGPGCPIGSGVVGGGLVALPNVRNNLTLGSRASFSGRGLHLGKTWRERCSWRCAAIILIFLSATLAALLAYFAGKILLIVFILIQKNLYKLRTTSLLLPFN